jgi:hypothetical protein
MTMKAVYGNLSTFVGDHHRHPRNDFFLIQLAKVKTSWMMNEELTAINSPHNNAGRSKGAITEIDQVAGVVVLLSRVKSAWEWNQQQPTGLTIIMFRRKGNTIINARWAMCKALVKAMCKATCKATCTLRLCAPCTLRIYFQINKHELISMN